MSVKEGTLWAGWVNQYGGGVARFEVDGDRIGVLTNSGELLVKDGNLYDPWVSQASGVADFHIAGDRIGIRRADRTLAVKEGTLYASWTEQIGDVADFDLTPTRIGVVTTGGLATVKEGTLWEGWINQMGGVKAIELAGNRLGVVRTDGSLAVKEGDLYATWTEQIGGVADVDITAERIGVVTTGGLATVKEGSLYAGWVNQLGGAADIELAGNRLAVLRADGSLAVKEGDLYATWTEQANGVSQVDLAAAPAPGAGGQVTIEDLRAIFGTIGAEATVIEGLPSLNAEMERAGITTPARKAAFLATLRHESGFRYNAVEVTNPDPYKGRGYIQLTSLANYQGAGNHLGQDFAANPDLAASLQWSAPIARYYWTVARSGSNAAADAYDMGLISRYVGYRASSAEDLERCADFKAALRYFSGGVMPVPDSAVTCLRH
ncbi:glycoside hydrolase family 19 protein [Actinokineospora soli]|uniref:Glycoside hydrolase family 19 protein n=1 Tax=Actinokineospora soli TaxID=1048753 RepID=A0ABW2TRF4_9PSEU